jgi:hypothetical protein
MYKRLRYAAAPHSLQRVLANADEGATWRLYYKNGLQMIHTKQTTTENVQEYVSAVGFQVMGSEIKFPPANNLYI